MRKDYLQATPEDKLKNEREWNDLYWTKHLLKYYSCLTPREIVTKREEFPFLKNYIDKLHNGVSLLEGGCGNGEWVLYFHSLGINIKGIDISSKVTEALKEKFPDQSQNFIEGDIRNTGFRDNTFDLYFSWGVFEHFEAGLGPSIDEARRVLKKGGLLIISVPFHNLWHTFRKDAFKYSKDMRFYQWRFTISELRAELSSCGFDVLEIKPINKGHGISRFIKNYFHINFHSKFHNLFKALLMPFFPRCFIAHSLIVAAAKRD